jgi:hypothetical protein
MLFREKVFRLLQDRDLLSDERIKISIHGAGAALASTMMSTSFPPIPKPSKFYLAMSYYKSLETGRRIFELGRELEIARILAVANKLRDREDEKAVSDYAGGHEIPVVAWIPYDDALPRAEKDRRPAIETGGDGVREIEALAARLGLLTPSSEQPREARFSLSYNV